MASLEHRIKHGWDISAKGYSTFVVEDLDDAPTAHAWFKELSAASDAAQRLCAPVLDLGCGPGIFTALLSAAGIPATALDISPDMLKHARENVVRFARKSPSYVEPRYVTGSATELPFDDHSLAAIVSRNVVWTLPDPVRAYREMQRVLKPGGALVVFDGDWLADLREGTETPIDLPDESMSEEEYAKHHSFPKGTYEEARGWRNELYLADKKRPEWDMELLRREGWERVSLRTLGPTLDELTRGCNEAIRTFVITAHR